MKYKALFLDLDGTTVEIGGTVPSQRVVNAVLAADKLMHVCLATGRFLLNAKPVVEVLKLSGLCVISNGIQIYDPRQKLILEEISLNKPDIPKVLQVLRKYRLTIRYFNGDVDKMYAQNTDHDKILSLYVENIERKVSEQVISDLSFLPEVTSHQMVVKSNSNSQIGLEVCHVRATKQYGIAKVAKRLGISTHEIIGIGDGYNDFPLLMACGFRVAMGNAVAELKAIADFIAPPVQEDGVAVVIEKFILSPRI